MRRTALLMAGALGCAPAGAPGPESAADSEAVVLEWIGFDRPVSVLHDSVDDVYLVANVPATGAPFIARVAPSGQLLALRWIDGAATGVELGAPGGMALRGDTIYVADGGCLRRFDRATGVVTGDAVCPASALALNGVAVDERGSVYTSDAGSGTVYRIDGPAGTQVARDAALEGSEGLAAGGPGVFIASGGLYQLAPDGPRAVIRAGGDRLGGVIFTRGGSFAFTRRADSTVLFVEARENGSRGAVWTLVRDVPSAGFLGYDGRRQRILVPDAETNRLVIVGIRP